MVPLETRNAWVYVLGVAAFKSEAVPCAIVPCCVVVHQMVSFTMSMGGLIALIDEVDFSHHNRMLNAPIWRNQPTPGKNWLVVTVASESEGGGDVAARLRNYCLFTHKWNPIIQ